MMSSVLGRNEYYARPKAKVSATRNFLRADRLVLLNLHQNCHPAQGQLNLEDRVGHNLLRSRRESDCCHLGICDIRDICCHAVVFIGWQYSGACVLPIGWFGKICCIYHKQLPHQRLLYLLCHT